MSRVNVCDRQLCLSNNNYCNFFRKNKESLVKLIKKFFLVLLLISSVYFISCGGGGGSGSSSGGTIGFILEEGKDVKVVNVSAGSFTLNKNWEIGRAHV